MHVAAGTLRHRSGHGANGRARGIEVIRRGWEHPVLQFSEHRPFSLGLFNFIEPLEVRVLGQFRGHLPAGSQEHNRQGFEPFLALDRHHILPPIVAGEILAAELEFVEVILEQNPSALGILAGGEEIEQFPAIVFVLAGIGKFAAQFSQHTVRIIQRRSVGVVFHSGPTLRSWLTCTFFTAWHLKFSKNRKDYPSQTGLYPSIRKRFF